MISSPSSVKRHLVPRWRSLSRTIESGELSWPAARGARSEQGSSIPNDLVRRLEKWRRSPDTISAAELVESAIVHAHESEAVNAARFLVGQGARSVPLVKKQAAMVLKRTGHEADIPTPLRAIEVEQTRLWRVRTRLHPHDALAWVELALAELSSGKKRYAERSMKVALQLAPHNRHILRAAARLYLHNGDPEQAHSLLRDNPASRHDPWLMAAEIALAPSAERKPHFMKRGLALLETGNHLPRQITELAGALGTNFMLDGNRKRGKRLFGQSMADPTGNSLAQAEWVSENFGEEIVRETQLRSSSDAAEALALHFFHSGDFAESLAFVRLWIQDEPVSTRAKKVGAGIANSTNEYALAAELAKEGLRWDPTSGQLLNSLAFALACLAHFDEAERILRRIAADEDEMASLVADANRGLIALRRGNTAMGEDLYRKVIAGFRRQGNRHMECLARAYFARESARAGLNNASEIVAEMDERTGQRSPHCERVLNEARSLLKALETTERGVQKALHLSS